MIFLLETRRLKRNAGVVLIVAVEGGWRFLLLRRTRNAMIQKQTDITRRRGRLSEVRDTGSLARYAI